MTVLDPREVTAQQAGALFNITLRHASLKAEVADGLADIHRCATNSISRLNAKTDCKKRCSIVTRLVPSGKWKFLVVDFPDSSGGEKAEDFSSSIAGRLRRQIERALRDAVSPSYSDVLRCHCGTQCLWPAKVLLPPVSRSS